MLTESELAYHDLEAACAKIDRRKTTYRFDTERDIPWARVNQAGAYFGRDLLAKLGIDVEALVGHGRALQILEWSLALASCRAFALFEELIVDFTAQHSETLTSRSVDLLNREEHKHIEVFRRYGEHLASQHPVWAKRFFELHDSSLKIYREQAEQERFPSEAANHFTFWLNTLFFEEYTIYFAQMLEESTDEIQPVWLALNEVHRREESQHVLTDAAHLRDANLNDAERALWSKYFYFRLEREIEVILGLDVARQMVLELEPSAAAVLETENIADTELFADIFRHPAFRYTRRNAPAMMVDDDSMSTSMELRVPALASSRSARRSVSHLVSRRLSLAPGSEETLIDALCRAIDINPEAGVTLVGSKGSETKIDYAELLERAESKLSGLRARGLTKGDVCLLILETDIECLSTFWGCILGGIQPALMAPPLAGKGHQDFGRRLIPVWDSLQRPLIVGQISLVAGLSEVVAEQTGGAIAECVSTESLDCSSGSDDAWSPSHPNDTAFIQFSSGSTGTPKGVCLTHQNVLHDMAGMLEHRGGAWMDVFCSWMPLYHDMGLIGFHLTPVLAGANQVLIRPYDFVRRPLLWLQKLTEHRGTITSANNFSLERALCGLERRPDLSLDLSSVRLIIAGSEPLSAKVIASFMSVLEPFGLSNSAMCPAYGLAEATLAVTMWTAGSQPSVRYFDRTSSSRGASVVELDESDDGAVAMVDLGTAIPECELRVVDDERATVREGVVGKILVRGPSVFARYYGRPSATALAKRDGWLNTGDLGFVLDGRLFVSGRVKDVLFVNGQNFFANDLEAALHSIDGLGSNRVAVVGWTDEKTERERVVVFAHPAPREGTTRDEVRLDIALTINRILGRPADDILWVKPRDFLRTTSGKLQRNKMREAYRAGQFSVSSEETSETKFHPTTNTSSKLESSTAMKHMNVARARGREQSSEQESREPQPGYQ